MVFPAWSAVREPKFMAECGVFFLLVLGVVWKMNHHALRQQIQPRIEELDKLRADMLAAAA